MNDSLIEGLLRNDDDAVAAFGESENCVVTDWRDGGEEILASVGAFLPEGYWQIEKAREHSWRLSAGGRPPEEIVFTPRKQEPFFASLNRILAPDYELWQYSPCDGDGYSLLLRPTIWWREFAAKHPEALAKYFVSAERLERYWRKTFLQRLFTKP